MNTKTKILTLTAILAAITLLLGILPIGFIPIVPGFIEITIMCVPVIVGVLVLGVRSGVMLGALFALTSIITAFTRSALGQLLLAENVFFTLVILVVPRVLIPVTTWLVYRLMRTKRETVNLAVASAVGSATNTVLFLALLALFFDNLLAGQIFTFAAFVNGIIEAALAAFVCPPIVRALRKTVPYIGKANHKETQRA